MSFLTDFVKSVGPSTLFYTQVPLFSALEGYADVLNSAASLGDIKVARMLLCLALAYPLGVLTPYFPHSSLRHLWCLIMGVLCVQCVFGVGWLHLLIPSSAVYAVSWLFRATGVLPGLGHWVAAVISFSYLIFRHLSRDAAFANGIDDSTLTMVLVVKLYTLCYNLYDAEALARKPLSKEVAEWSPKLTETRRARSVPHFPNPLAFYAYVFNFSTVFTGPAFEFGAYMATQEQAAPLPQYLGSRFVPGLWKLLQGVVWFGLTAWLQVVFATDDLYALSQTEPSTPRYALAVVLALVCSRFKYYAIWKLSEGAAVLAGFGFREKGGRANPAVGDFESITGWKLRQAFVNGAGVDNFGLGVAGAADWEAASNCNPITVETRVSIKDTIDNWNTHVQSWLANYIFLRLPRSLSRPVTFLASAFWHGFYPGYYFTFVTAWLFQDAARNVNTALEPLFPGIFSEGGTIVGPTTKAEGGGLVYSWSTPLRLLVWLLQWVIHTLFLTYAGAAFVIIGQDPHCTQGPAAALPAYCGGVLGGPSVLARIAAIYGRLGWWCHAVAGLLFVATTLLAVGGKGGKGGKDKEGKDKEGKGEAKVEAGKAGKEGKGGKGN